LLLFAAACCCVPTLINSHIGTLILTQNRTSFLMSQRNVTLPLLKSAHEAAVANFVKVFSEAAGLLVVIAHQPLRRQTWMLARKRLYSKATQVL